MHLVQILDLSCVVRSDRRFTLPQLLLEEAQPRVQRVNLQMDVRQVADDDVQLRELIKIVRHEAWQASGLFRCPKASISLPFEGEEALKRALKALPKGVERPFGALR